MNRVVLLFSSLLLAAATPLPQQSKTPEATNPAQKHEPAAGPNASIGNQSSTPSATATTNYCSYNYYYPTGRSQSPPIWFQEATTVILLLFTGGLWRTSIWQWRAIKKQSRIANETLNVTHRAQIRVRNVAPVNPIDNVAPVTVRLTLVNYGATDAEITGTSFGLGVHENFDLPVPFRPNGRFSTEREGIDNQVLGAGVTLTVGKEYRIGDSSEMGRFFRNELHMYCYGYIDYRDKRGIFHRTAFCRKYDRTKRLFVAVNDPDFEYQD